MFVKANGWMVNSWNEMGEGTYFMLLERYGDQSLLTLNSIIHDSPVGSGA
jgi:hypothetical protein